MACGRSPNGISSARNLRDPGDLTRWLILGPGGAGKTRLALELSRVLDLPLIHLDRHYWKPGWLPSADEEWAQRVSELAASDAWVMDGNYSGTLHLRVPRAQAVILLDPPTVQCLWGVVGRGLGRRGTRPDMAPGCEERVLPDLQFLFYVATYRRRSRPRVLRRIRAVPDVRLFWFRSRRQAWTFVRGLEPATQRPEGTEPAPGQ